MPSAAAKKQNPTPETKPATDKPVAAKPVAKEAVKEAPKDVAKEAPKEVVKDVVEVVPPATAKKTRNTKTAAPTTVTKVDDTPVATATTEEGVEPVAGEDVIKVLVDKIASLAGLVKDIQSSLKPVLKEHDKLKKVVERIQKKRDNARKSPSGFAKPNKISDELCDFIGVPHGTEKSRTEITRYINAYVKEHNLNNPTNRRVILPDEKLKKIFKINNGEDVTFFVLQRLISHHFPTANSKLAPAAPPSVASA
jgi:chromatin remodeling complex protein RSC6